jgi:hypothetical protein
MKLDELRPIIAKRSGKPEIDNSDIDLVIVLTLESIDALAQWHFAMPTFEETLNAGEKSAPVIQYPLFRPISCSIAVGGRKEYPLTFRQLTDFDEADVNYGRTITNVMPRYYTIANNEVVIGPGVLSDSAVLAGRYQRRLGIEDVDLLPGNLIIERSVMVLTDAGTPAQIRAWALWKEEKANTLANNKPSNEIRDTKPMDSQIYSNNEYLKSLR